MKLDDLYLWYLGDPATPRHVGALKLVAAGKGVSLRYSQDWLATGFPLSEDLPLVDNEFLPPGRLSADTQRAVGAVDDARPDRWGQKVIRFVDRQRLPFAGSTATRVAVSTASRPARPSVRPRHQARSRRWGTRSWRAFCAGSASRRTT